MDHTPWPSGIYPRNARLVQHTKKLVNVMCHVNRLKGRNHTIISIGAERVLDKIQNPFMIGKKKKSTQKLGIEGTFSIW